MNNSLKQEILDYEKRIFENYIIKRNHLIKIIENTNFDSLNNNQLEILVNDLKEITESVKESCENINYFSLNNSKKFKMNNTIENKKKLARLSCIVSHIWNIYLDSDSDSDSLNSEPVIEYSDSESLNSEPVVEYSDAELDV